MQTELNDQSLENVEKFRYLGKTGYKRSEVDGINSDI